MSHMPDANRDTGPDRDARSDPNAETQVVRQPPNQGPEPTMEMPTPPLRRETEREVVHEPVQERRVVREPIAREREVVREPVARAPVAREREVVRDRPPARRREVAGGGMGSGALVALILLTIVAVFIAYLLVQAVGA